MKDKHNNILIPGCTLRSEISGKHSTEIIYKDDNTFEVPGGGHMYHNSESLAQSYWVVIDYPKESKQTTHNLKK